METTTNKRDLDLSRENRGKINEGESRARWRGNFPSHPQGLIIYGSPWDR